jgi:hypothetical protein
MIALRDDCELAGGAGYLWRKITPAQASRIKRAHAAGVTARSLAGEYSVCVRTIYRAIHLAEKRLVTVHVGDWFAEYALDDDGPVRVSPWYAA